MTARKPDVIGGVDCHADTHESAVLNAQGRLLATARFATTVEGYQHLLEWMSSHGHVLEVGVEGSGSYGAGLTRHLRAAGIKVVEVNRPHPHTRARRGNNDAIDAEAAARKVLAGECTAVPKDTTGIVEAIRQLHLARASAVQARTAALNQLDDLIVTAPADVRQALTAKTLPGKAGQCARWRPDRARLAEPAQAARTALRSIARRIHALGEKIATLDAQLSTSVKRAAPKTLALLGVGPVHAAQMLITAGQNITRLRTETAFAHLCGADPIPAPSGKTERHRLNPGGDRHANRTLYMIAIVRLRYCQRTRDYTTRRITDGKSKKEIIRCLKRYISREIYYTLVADLQNLAPATRRSIGTPWPRRPAAA
ncbi:IS110 family transposase [Dactylosporangium sp. McL0621]|uniref:IS110 family transposase n=1 Tax=Dactylosporangium sp. McL0621 TaxID=3415678 RepID=UPI003CE6D2DA